MYNVGVLHSTTQPRPRPRRRATPWPVLALLAVAALVAATGCAASTTDTAAEPAPTSTTGSTPMTATAPSSTVTGEPPGTAVAASARTFVGRVADSALAVATVVDGDRLLVYLCDGATGARIGGALATSDSTVPQTFITEVLGVGPLTLTIAAGEVSGTIGIAGVGHAVAVTPAVGSGGLLWATGTASDGTAIKAGWIVQNDGTETGGLVTSIIDGTSNTNVPLPTGAITDGTSNTLAPTGPTPAVVADRSAIIATLVPVRQPLASLK
jgi:hypothetical protein